MRSKPDARRKVLIMTTGQVLTPRSGGELRTHHLAVELSALGYEVDVVSLVVSNHPRRHRRITPYLTMHELHSLWLDMAAVADRLRLIPATELPVWLRPLRGLLRRLQRRKRYDFVQFEFPWFVHLYGAVADGTRVIYDAHNVESDWWGPQLARYPFAGKFRERLLRHEQLAIIQADAVATCSQTDRAWILDQAPTDPERVHLVPNGFDARYLRRPTVAERERLREAFGFRPDQKIALFLGSNTAPNREAAELILQRIAPQITDPRVRLVIAGKVGAALRQDASERVTITGPLGETLPYLQAADVGLNPMQSGSGSNIKLAEYCAAGLPTITSEFGLRGFEELRPWLAVCEVDGFASALEAAEWPNRAPEATLAQYSWTQAARRLAALYEAISPSGEPDAALAAHPGPEKDQE